MVLLAQDTGFWNSWLGETVGLLSIPALVGLNGFFVAAEFALVAVRKTRVEELVTHKVPGAASVAKAVSQHRSNHRRDTARHRLSEPRPGHGLRNGAGPRP